MTLMILERAAALAAKAAVGYWPGGGMFCARRPYQLASRIARAARHRGINLAAAMRVVSSCLVALARMAHRSINDRSRSSMSGRNRKPAYVYARLCTMPLIKAAISTRAVMNALLLRRRRGESPLKSGVQAPVAADDSVPPCGGRLAT